MTEIGAPSAPGDAQHDCKENDSKSMSSRTETPRIPLSQGNGDGGSGNGSNFFKPKGGTQYARVMHEFIRLQSDPKIEMFMVYKLLDDSVPRGGVNSGEDDFGLRFGGIDQYESPTAKATSSKHPDKRLFCKLKKLNHNPDGIPSQGLCD